MRTEWVITLVATSAIGSAVVSQDGETFDPLGPLVGDRALMERAEEIALRDFAVKGQLEILEVWTQDTRIGVFNETIEADPGYTFFFCRVRLENVGKMDFSASTWHFSGIDEIGSDHSAELANAHEDFDGSRLRVGGARTGVVIFEMERTMALQAIVWQGELANATAPYEGGVPEHRTLER